MWVALPHAESSFVSELAAESKYAFGRSVKVCGLLNISPPHQWAKYQKFDVQNARVEVVDMLHFLVSLAQVLGMSAQDFYDAYAKKNHINHNRQDSGYVEKDENDCRSI